MSNPNIPSASPESKNTGSNKRNNLTPLLKKGVKSIFGKGDVANPSLYPIKKNDDGIGAVIQAMKDIRDGDDTWSDTTDDEIGKIRNSIILGDIESYGMTLRNARQNAVRRFYATFKGLTLEKAVLLESIEGLDENALSNLYASRANMKRFLKENHSIDTSVLDASMFDFRKIFVSDTIKTRSPDLYKRLEYAGLQYEKSGAQPPKALIKEALGFYENNFDKKNAICEYFDLTFTLPEALSLEIANPDTPSKIAERIFETTWKDLDKETRDKLIRKIQTDDTVELTLSELDREQWKKFIDGKKISNLITDKIYNRAALIEEGAKNKKSITSSLQLDANGKVHSSWLEGMQERIGTKITNLRGWTEGKVLVFEDRKGNPQYFQLIKSDIDIGNLMNPGVRLASLAGLKAGSIGRAKGESDISYEELADFLENGVKTGEIMSEETLRARATKDISDAVDEGGVIGLKGDEKVLDMSDTEDETSIEYLTDAINRIDPEGKEINDGKVEAGLAFEASSAPDEHGVSKKGVYTIKKISNSLITISGSTEEETTTYADFVETIDKQGLKRVAHLDPEKEDESFLKALGKYNVDLDYTKLENGDLVTEIEEHIDDGHGHTTTKKTKGKYEYFKSEGDGGHIRLAGIKDGFVYFGEYESSKTFDDVKKIHKSKKLSGKQQKGLYKWRTVRYGTFLKYLKDNKLSATTENLLDPHAGHAHEPHEHFEGSFFSKLGKMYSINDIIKGVSNLKHHVEHYFEKTSKLNASRFTLGLAKKLGLPADLIAQAQSEEVTSVKEIIEKLKDKLGNLNGPHGRTKALHIAHNKDARPEEVAAAMLYMVRGYGQLYAEDIAYAQGSYSFLNGFLNACGFRSESERTAMRQKAREKFLSDMGNEGGEPTEEELIWGFMKTMDGKYEEYPLAGTVVKAMGGPSGWEKAWRTEGFEGAYEKGKRQGGDTVNAKGRVSKGLSSLATFEYNSAIGYMEKAAGKDPDPSIQTIPVVWALGGYSQYGGTKVSQEIKKYGDSMGHSFHAYAFLRNHADNLVFRSVFRKKLSEIASPRELDSFDNDIKILQKTGEHLTEVHAKKYNDNVKVAITNLANIWDKYQARGLHDALQGKNGWLMEKANAGDIDIQKYLKKINISHQTMGDKDLPSNDNGWLKQRGYDGSPIMDFAELDGKKVFSLARTLRKIRIHPQNFEMDENDKLIFWPSVVSRVREVKNISDTSLRAAQYNQYRSDILTIFRNAINPRGMTKEALEDLKRKSYYRDLLEMGIDPELIVSPGETDKVIRTTSGEDLIMWMGGGRGSGNSRHETVEEIMRDTVEKIGRGTYKQGASDTNKKYREEGEDASTGNYTVEAEGNN